MAVEVSDGFPPLKIRVEDIREVWLVDAGGRTLASVPVNPPTPPGGSLTITWTGFGSMVIDGVES
jgi:hypothetical protein